MAKVAKAKTKSTKGAQKKKSATKKGGAIKKKSGKRAAHVTLSHQERLQKLHPQSALDVSEVTRAWDATPGLRIDGLTRKKLLGMKRKSERAHAKEDARARKNEEKLRPLRDARLQADDVLWRAVLDVKAQAEVLARHHPEVGERFAFLVDLFRHARPAKRAPSAKDAPPTK